MSALASAPFFKRFTQWFVRNGPYALVVASLIPDYILLRPTPAELRLCDSAVAALIGAQDQVSLDRAKFIINRENCGIAKRTDRASSALN